MADEEAKMGALSISVWSDTLRPWKNTLRQIEQRIEIEWENRWAEIYKHDATKFFIPKPDKNKAKHILQLCRADLAMLTRAITGQNFLAYHQSKIDFTISKTCRLCEEQDETFIHLITDCPRLELTRRDIFLDNQILAQEPWSIRKVLQFIYIPGLFQMLTSKEGLPEKEVIYIDHTYSDSSED